jgi:TFA2 Winged helix domain 2
MQRSATNMASNAYGFDFLQKTHLAEEVASDNEADYQTEEHSKNNKPDLEKQFDIIAFLQNHRGSGFLTPAVIYKSTGIDLQDADATVAEMLEHNPKVQIERIPDPENPALLMATYSYKAKYNNVRDRATLLALINSMKYGVSIRDLEDSYLTVTTDLEALITAGDVIAIASDDKKNKRIFSRGQGGAFLVELDGVITLPPGIPSAAGKSAMANGSNSGSHHVNGAHKNDGEKKNGLSSNGRVPVVYSVETDMDPLTQIRRGEAIQVGGQWFRVSSAIKDGPLSEQPAKAQAPLSVAFNEDLSNPVYFREFKTKSIPLDAPLPATALGHISEAQAARERLIKLTHGRTGGGAAAQLLKSHAHSNNPTALAATLAGGSATNTVRKRPHVKMSNTTFVPSRQGKETIVEVASNPSMIAYTHARRHGCTKDVRQLYLATRDWIPEADADLQALLVKHKLLEPGEQLRLERLAKTREDKDNDGKKKKRRYYERKGQRMTNTHLDGTALGGVLARAMAQQNEGKTVGDGGM